MSNPRPHLPPETSDFVVDPYLTNERHLDNVASSLNCGYYTPEPTLLPASAADLEPMEEHSPQSYRLDCVSRPYSFRGFAQAIIVADA